MNAVQKQKTWSKMGREIIRPNPKCGQFKQAQKVSKQQAAWCTTIIKHLQPKAVAIHFICPLPFICPAMLESDGIKTNWRVNTVLQWGCKQFSFLLRASFFGCCQPPLFLCSSFLAYFYPLTTLLCLLMTNILTAVSHSGCGQGHPFNPITR